MGNKADAYNLGDLLTAHAVDMAEKETILFDLKEAITIEEKRVATLDDEIHDLNMKIGSTKTMIKEDQGLKIFISEKLSKLSKRSKDLEMAALQIQGFRTMFQNKIKDDTEILQKIQDENKNLANEISQKKENHKNAKGIFRAELKTLERNDMELSYKFTALEAELETNRTGASEISAKLNDLVEENTKMQHQQEIRKEEMLIIKKEKTGEISKLENDFKQQNVVKDEALKQALKEVDEKRIEKDELDQRLRKVTAQLISKKLEYDRMETECLAFDRDTLALDAEIEAATTQIQLLKKDLVQQECDKAMEIKTMNEDFENFKIRNAEAKKEHEDKKKELHIKSIKVKEESHAIEREVHRLRNLKSSVQEDIEAKMMNAASLAMTLNNLKEKQKREEVNLETFAEKKKRFVQEHKEMLETVEKLEKLRINLKESYETKQNNKREIEKILDKLEFSVNRMIHELEAKVGDSDNKTRLIKTIITKLEDFKDTLKEKENAIAEMMVEIKMAQEDKEAQLSETARLTSQVKKMSDEKEEKTDEKNKLYKMLVSIKEQTDKSLTDLRRNHVAEQIIFADEIKKYQTADIERDEATDKIRAKLEMLKRQSKDEIAKRLKITQELKALKAASEKERVEREGKILKIRQNRDIIKTNMKVCIEKYQLHQKLITDFLMEYNDATSESEFSG